MIDTPITEPERKKIVILYRATTVYRRSSVQSTIRFLSDRVEHVAADGYEFSNAEEWWRKLEADAKQRLEDEYKFASKH